MNAHRPSVVDPAAPGYVSRQVESSRLFWFHLAPGEREELTVVSAGYEVTRPDFRIDRPGFDWFCFEFVRGGAGRLVIDDRELALGPGVFFLYGPGVGHHIRSDRDEPLRKYFLVFTGGRAAKVLGRTGFEPGAVAQSTNPEALRAAFDELIGRGSRKTAFAHDICAALTRQILFMAREDSVETGATATRAFATYQRVRRFMAHHFLEVATLEGIAKGCGLDAAYLCRLFARFQSETPYQHLTRLRMEHAAKRLLDGGLAVKEVARELGFSDPFHFSRVFKSVHRVPPSQFRRGGVVTG